VTPTSGPKSVMFVLDSSFSMAGTRMRMLVEATKLLLGTLSIVDYFGVVHFNSNAYSLTKTVLKKPTSSFLAEVFDSLDDLGPIGKTNVFEGFTKAFDILEKSVELGEYTPCNVAVIFITDGEPSDDPQLTLNLIREKAALFERITFFTFSLGEEASTDFPKQIACEFNGVWTPITNPEALVVQMSHLFEYFTIMNTDPSDTVIWSEPYVDAFGAGWMVTASQAVYARPSDYENPNFDHPYLIGVVGVDVLLSDLRKEGSTKEILAEFQARNEQCPQFTINECLLYTLRNKVYGTSDLGIPQVDRQCGPQPPGCVIREDICLGSNSTNVTPKSTSVCAEETIDKKEIKKRSCCGGCTPARLGIAVIVLGFILVLLCAYQVYKCYRDK